MNLSAVEGPVRHGQAKARHDFEDGELRTGSGNGLRVVRVGTHAVSAGAKTTLWKRLYQHKGTTKTGGGNHRGSIFRLNIGTALQQSGKIASISTWGQNRSAPAATVKSELQTERHVSMYIGKMPFLYIRVEDKPDKNSVRSFLEKNLIGLLSEYNKPAIDPPSKAWLGKKCKNIKIQTSALWNSDYVELGYDPKVLNVLNDYIEMM